MMSRNGWKSRELFYLSLVVTLTIGLSLFYVSLSLFDRLAGFLREYAALPHSDLLVQVLFVYLTVLIWVLYRFWRKALRCQQELEDIISSINPDTLLVVDHQGRIVKCNKSVESMFDYRVEEVLGEKTTLLIPENGWFSGCAAACPGSAAGKKLNVRPATGRKKNGDLIPLEIILADLNGSSGRVILLRDITERKKTEQELVGLTAKLGNANEHLQRLANIDPLTELLNRRGLEHQLTAGMDKARREGIPMTAILLDLDDFKQINDTLGHAVGDLVLKEVAKRLKAWLRSTDTIGRIGGDEFLIFLPETRRAEAMVVAERLRRVISTSRLPVCFETVAITVSMGVASLPFEVSSIEETLSLTRSPLQRSKRTGKNTVSTMRETGVRLPEESQVSEVIVEKLLREDCFYPVAQPIYRLSDRRLTGYELLTRSDIEDIKMPADLFRFTLENNILTHVDLKCLKNCIGVAGLFDDSLRLHVNLFPSTILATPIDSLIGLLSRVGRDRAFCVEISEQQFIGEPSYLKGHIAALKHAGIRVAIDDLGYGRSSLESLIILEPDIVKIDRLYIDGVAADKGKRRSLERMLKMVRGLGAEEIAEGIEKEEDLEVLRDMGVACGQGYLLGRPARVEPLAKPRHDRVPAGISAESSLLQPCSGF